MSQKGPKIRERIASAKISPDEEGLARYRAEFVQGLLYFTGLAGSGAGSADGVGGLWPIPILPSEDGFREAVRS